MSLLIEQTIERQGPLLIDRLCSSCGLSRKSFYRYRNTSDCVDADMALRDRIQKAALENSSYGYRRITEELRRHGVIVNHKRILRLMRQDNLLCLRKKRFVATTDSNHGHHIYPNLARDLQVTDINQLWVADLTYIRLGAEFIYLAVILDVYSRRCVGWALGRSLEASLCVEALQMALKRRQPPSGLVHHSDRGVQYASREYTDILKSANCTISMSRKGNPYDNAYAESFMKTLKYEEVHLNEYETIQEARASIAHFLEIVYNQKRLHSAIGYLPPVEFEHKQAQTDAQFAGAVPKAGTGLSLLTRNSDLKVIKQQEKHRTVTLT